MAEMYYLKVAREPIGPNSHIPIMRFSGAMRGSVPSRAQRGAVSVANKKPTYAFVYWRVLYSPGNSVRLCSYGLRPAPLRFAEISSRKRGTNGEILFLALMRGHRRHPGGRSLFPLIAGDGPLVRAVCIHHEKLRIGLGAPVIERSFIAKAQARAAEHDVLAVGRPRTVSVISGGVRQLLKVGAIRPDGENFVRVCAACIAREADAVAQRR